MQYATYLLCFLLMLPAAGAIFWIRVIAVWNDGGELFGGSWQLPSTLAGALLLLIAGAIGSIRPRAFEVLALTGTVAVAYCLFHATRDGIISTLVMAVVVSPTIGGILLALWYAVKYQPKYLPQASPPNPPIPS